MKLPQITGITLSILLLHVFSGQLSGQENYIVTDITFKGNDHFSKGELLANMSTYATNGFQRKLLRKTPFHYSENILNVDLERMTRFYQQEGFLYVTVKKGKLTVDHEQEEVKIAIEIFEGKPVMVNDIGFQFDSPNTPAGEIPEGLLNKIYSSLTLRTAERFRDAAARDDQLEIIRRFKNAGYPYVEVTPLLEVISEENLVDLTWKIDSGSRNTFGEIDIIGNTRVSDRLIRNQLAFQPGDIYRQKLIEKSRRQIYGLGIFQIVSVRALFQKADQTITPVVIQVNEARRLRLKFGLGYGSEERFRAFLDGTRLGFLGGARRLELFLKHSFLEPIRAELTFAQPAFPVARATLLLNPFIRQENEPAYKAERFGGKITTQYEVSANTDVYLTYTIERVTLDTANVSQQEGVNNLPENFYNKSFTTFGFIRNTATPQFSPNNGINLGLTLTLSGRILSSGFSYRKTVIDFRRYQPFQGNTVLAYRIKVGSLVSLEEDNAVPIEERFYAGGANSVRGWPRSGLGPLDEDGQPLGGKSLLEGNLEQRFELWESFVGAFFIDFGNVWLDSFGYKLNELRYALGVGVGYSTPVGPIRLDIAKPVFDEKQSFQFHFSVGHSF